MTNLKRKGVPPLDGRYTGRRPATKLIMLADAGHTGFGTVTRDLGRRLIDLGMDVRFISQNVNSEPLPEPFASRTWNAQHPTFDFVGSISKGFSDGWKADALFMLGDFFAARNLVFAADAIAAALAATPTFHYCPVEGVDLPPAWKRLWDVVRPVAMTEFGADQIEKVTGSRPPMIYHGVETDDFYPVAPNRPGVRSSGERITTKNGAKAAFNYPSDRILCLRTDRHMPRKQQDALIHAMVPVFEAVPNLDLVLHCRWYDEGGLLTDEVSKLPLELQGRVLSTNRAHNTYTGLPRMDLNIMYNAADIYVSTSAEGFGLTIAEALACGVPVVAMDYSAVPEVVGPAGVLVPPSHLLYNEYNHKWAAVDEQKFADAVIHLATKPARRRSLGMLGPAHVRNNFSWERSARQFADLIETTVSERAEAAA